MTSRREVLQLGAFGALGLVGMEGNDNVIPPVPLLTQSLLAPANMPVPYAGVFRRPPVLAPYQTGFDDGDPDRPFAKYALTQKLGQAQFVPGLSTAVAGYNGIYPGPTIRAEHGTRFEVRIRNALPSQGLLHSDAFNTVTHLHGSASLPQYDGYANDVTAPGNVKTYRYPNWQNARTLWYHDHNHHLTAQNVYSGLAGFYPLSDSYERAQLPQGEFDVPLMISDALFNADGSLGYNDRLRSSLFGDIIMVNGVPWPTMKVKPRIYRFRVLVASISRSYRPTLSTGDPVYIVATDSGMVPTVQPVASWRHSTAERYEILIDFRKYRVGQKISLNNLSNKNNVNFINTNKIMRFEVVADFGSNAGSISSIPTTLDDGGSVNPHQGGIATMSLTPAMAKIKRNLKVEKINGVWKINGTTWADVAASRFTKLFANPQPYDVEQWTITNASGGWFHPVHIHLIDAKIIGRNTNGGKPFAWENGPKDVFYVGENESITALMQFDTGPELGGRYMIHCHNLVHEDHDMMTQFAVGDYRVNDPINSDPAVIDTRPADFYPPVYLPGLPAGT
ncbi:multicopper oxidase family protein [Cryobacterium sp. TMT1-3]|uniref:Multicopper oxidase family protein n=1 Tax=Cryobacterium luteum TaxID=1424661 RepID=A0A1H8I0P1_9MICO|nr:MULTISPECIES: multicopper oxidase domain-containing protein [Cryobacterium]TFB94247.1 multicopper oxidase family protein [Cryobacterium luteum]TFC24765.1 multicopper oxidase family protein [Cryobacterium sp. TMT1-3]SEN61887.1 Multicopper oxidase with three cupredoxin domains (includes cell division protein FtsP and spore coat protein CotA) [Cryobacterium luteum]